MNERYMKRYMSIGWFIKVLHLFLLMMLTNSDLVVISPLLIASKSTGGEEPDMPVASLAIHFLWIHLNQGRKIESVMHWPWSKQNTARLSPSIVERYFSVSICSYWLGSLLWFSALNQNILRRFSGDGNTNTEESTA